MLEREQDGDADATCANIWSLKGVEEIPHKQHVLLSTITRDLSGGVTTRPSIGAPLRPTNKAFAQLFTVRRFNSSTMHNT